jgi:type II secretory pathway component PulJ
VDLVRATGSDTGDIVIGWLTRVVVAISLVGLAAFDAISIGVSRLAVEDTAVQAAREASSELQRTHDILAAHATAVAVATEANALNEVPPERFEVLPDGSIRLVVTRDATTFVVHRIGWIADWTQVQAQVTGKALV